MTRAMMLTITISTLAAACGSSSSYDDHERRIRELEARPLAARGEPGPMGPRGSRGEPGVAGPGGSAEPMPHLFDVDTGEDLGISLGGTRAYSTKAGGEVDFARPSDLFFQGCAGDGMIPEAYGPTFKQRVLVAAGLVVRMDGYPEVRIVDSVIRAGRSGSCEMIPPVAMSVLVATEITTFSAAPRPSWKLSVELPGAASR